MRDWKETLYRAARTFVQAALAYILTAIGGGIAGLFDAEGRLSKVAIAGLVVSALSAGLAALMNLPKPAPADKTEEEEYNEKIQMIMDGEASRKGE